jgi:hypothetical protein
VQTISNYAAAATTYIVAVISMFYANALENYSHIAAVLGFLLLVARLIQEKLPLVCCQMTRKSCLMI